MNRGFYKGHYLRNSYEYAYAKYLDYHSIEWDYENVVFDIGYKIYKPDFFFYDQNGNIIKIVEIKSRIKDEKDKAKNALNTIEDRFNIICELISYEELLKMYKGLPFSLTSTITEWIHSKDTSIDKANFGELNGHYNIPHSEDTKRIIGKNTKKLWASNSVAKQRMIEGLRNSGLVQSGKLKKPRENRICDECGEKFEVIITSTQRFCTQTCAGNAAIKIATVAYFKKRNQIHKEIRAYIIQWSIDNKEIVLATSFNKIKPTMKPLIENIQKLFGVKDYRVISKAVFGEDRGRKELLKFMQSV